MLDTQDSEFISPPFHLLHSLLAQQARAGRWKTRPQRALAPAPLHPSQSTPVFGPIRPRNTQGHGLIVNTVKTQREGGGGGAMTGCWELGGSLGRDGGKGGWGGGGQIAGGPISSLMASKRGNMRECCPVKQVTRRKGGQPHPPPNPHWTWTIHTHTHTSAHGH